MKAKLFWHVFLTGGTLGIAKDQIRFINRLNPDIDLEIVLVGDVRYLDAVKSLLTNSIKRQFTIIITEARSFEFDTIHRLWAEEGDYDYLGYIHTKGAGNPQPNSTFWRTIMTMSTVQDAGRSIADLRDGYDVSGLFWITPPNGQYFGGNSWWATKKYIKSLPEPVNPSSRWHCEIWIGLNNPKASNRCSIDELLNYRKFLDTSAPFGTDKNVHEYMKLYQLYLLNRFGTYNIRNLFEIGVYNGDSLRMWQKLMPNTGVAAMDIEPKTVEGIPVLLGDQSKRSDLASIPVCDVIIDDGGHRSDQQLISLVSMVDKAALYIIEDLHTSEVDLYSAYHSPGELTALDYLTYYPNLKPDYITDEEHARLKDYDIRIEQARFSPIAFIYKKDKYV